MTNIQNDRGPRVSVVCATYKRSRMVREAVLSAWSQTLRPDEILVSDDCSPDDTLEVLRALQQEVPVLRIVENVRNSGGVPNWNTVIEAAEGDIIAWCSDDDRLLPEHLERSVKYLAEHEDVGFVHSAFVNVEQLPDGSERRQDAPLKDSWPIEVDSTSLILYMARFYNWPFHPSTWVFRRSLWDKVGPFNPEYALADTDWFIRASLHSKLVYLPAYGVLNRRHADNWSNRVGAVGMQREFYQAMRMFLEAMTKQGQGAQAQRQFRRWAFVYRSYLLRIFVARARAGHFTTASECATAVTDASPLLARIPGVVRQACVAVLTRLLYGIQVALPGGRSKYKNLGVTAPK